MLVWLAPHGEPCLQAGLTALLGGLGSSAESLGEPLVNRLSSTHPPHRLPSSSLHTLTPPWSARRPAQLMKMHTCTEREAMEMITIITCLHQSSLGFSEKKPKGKKDSWTGLDSITHTFTGDRLICFRQLSLRRFCPFQAATSNVDLHFFLLF